MRVVMSISDSIEKCSYVLLDFEDALGAAHVCFSVGLEALRFVQEFGSFVRLEGLEFIHRQRVIYYIKE